MAVKRGAAALFGAFCFAAFAPCGAQAQDTRICDPATTAAAFRSGSLEQLLEINAKSTQVCKNSNLPNFCSGRLASLLYRDRAMSAAASGANLDQLTGILDKGKAISSSWQVLTALGEVFLAQGKQSGNRDFYGKAAAVLELAVNDVDVGATSCREFGEPNPPPAAEIGKLVRKMQEAKLLAPTFSLTPTRDVDCGGIFLTKVRDFSVQDVPVPVEFEYNQAILTPKGRQAASFMAKCAIEGKAAKIRLSGHTDLHGTPAYNMDLSAKRLLSVRSALMEEGYKGAVILEPKGMTEPFIVDKNSGYSPEEIDQMNRRVQLRDTIK